MELPHHPPSKDPNWLNPVNNSNQSRNNAPRNKWSPSVAHFRKRSSITPFSSHEAWKTMTFSSSESDNENVCIDPVKQAQRKEIRNLASILSKDVNLRQRKEEWDLFKYLSKTTIESYLRQDFAQADIDFESFFFFISKFIYGLVFNKGAVIYNFGDKSEYVYLVLKGSVGLYSMETANAWFTADEYYLYWDYKNNDWQSDELIILKIIEANKEKFPLYSMKDLANLKEIIFLVKVAWLANDNELDWIEETYRRYSHPLSKHDFNQVQTGKCSWESYCTAITSNFVERDYFYYNILKDYTTKFEVKKISYIKTRTLGKNDFFGNFKLGDFKAVRDGTAKAECDNVVWLIINKKCYSSLIWNEKRQVRENESEKVHFSYFFNVVTRRVFKEKIFFEFEINNFSHRQVLCRQDDQWDSFYIMKDGIVELSLVNITWIELHKKIIEWKGLVNDKKGWNKMWTKFPYNVIKTSLEIKRKFVVFKSEFMILGDLECFYKIPSIFQAEVYSTKAIGYSYAYEKFEKWNDSFILNESWRETCENKIKRIIERWESIEESYYSKINWEYSQKIKEETVIENPNQKNIDEYYQNLGNWNWHTRLNKYMSNYENEKMKIIEKYSPSSKNKSNLKVEVKRDNSYSPSNKNKSRQLNSYLQFREWSENVSTLPWIDSYNQSKKVQNKLGKSEVIGECYVKQPLRVSQNAPLINRLKQKYNSWKINRKPKKQEINLTLEFRTPQNVLVKRRIENTKGGYFIAVHQFINEFKQNRNKIEKNTKNNI